MTARTVASVAYGWMQYWTQDQGVTSVDVRVIYLYVFTNGSRLREHYQEQMQAGQEIRSDGKTGFECSREVAAGHMKTHRDLRELQTAHANNIQFQYGGWHASSHWH